MPDASFTFLAFFFKHALTMGEEFSTTQNRKLVKDITENCGEELQALRRAIERLQDREDTLEINTILEITNVSMAVLWLRRG